VINKSDIERAIECLSRALEQYPGKKIANIRT
jgi:hypothetical protein